jgi:hypothetical protein
MNPRELIVDQDESYSTGGEINAFTETADYSETPERLYREQDVLKQLCANLTHLEDVYGRLRFVLGEVQHVIQKRVSTSR